MSLVSQSLKTSDNTIAMKKKIFLFCALLFTMSFARAQNSIPHSVLDNFKQSHSSADYMTWSNEGDNFRVHYFDSEKVEHVKVYNASGDLIRHEYELRSNQIPAAISIKLAKNTNNSTSVKIWGVENSDKKVSYFSTDGSTIVKYNSSGELVK